jgi:hypothetical protein
LPGTRAFHPDGTEPERIKSFIKEQKSMNIKLVESLAQVILSLSEEERNLLYSQINVTTASSTVSQSIQPEVLDLENRLKYFEQELSSME